MVGMAPPRPCTLAGVGYAAVAYAAFLVTTTWAVTFLADRQLPRGMDHGSRPSPAVAVAVDLGLLLLFAAQHTIMARAGFKARLARWVPSGMERSTYVLATSAVLALLFWCWRPVGGEIWVVGGAPAAMLWVVFASGWLIAIGSTFMIDHLDFFGLRRAYRHAHNRPDGPSAFQERWFFAWVRHPLMVGLVVAFWATPDMSAGHLLFALAATAYVAVGVRFEERDLRRELGAVYSDYAARVPAFLPTRLPGRG